MWRRAAPNDPGGRLGRERVPKMRGRQVLRPIVNESVLPPFGCISSGLSIFDASFNASSVSMIICKDRFATRRTSATD